MTQLLTIIGAALAAASLYITFGVGFAFVYRVTGVLNFAYGAIASVAAYIAYSLLEDDIPYIWAALIAIVCGVVISALIYLVLVIHIPARSAEAIGILTLGVAIVLQGVLQAIYGGEPLALPAPVRSSALFTIGDYGVNASTLLNAVIAAAVVLALGFVLYRTRLGLRIRAVSEGGVTSSMFGVNPTVVNTIVWAIGGGLGALTAMLVTPVNQLSPSFMTFFLLTAFVAVVLGGFESITGIVIGAVILSLIQSMVATYVTSQLTATVSFVVIVFVLFFLPKGLLGRTLMRVVEPSLPRYRRYSLHPPGFITRAMASLSPHRRSPLRSTAAVVAVPVVVGAILILIAPQLTPTAQLLIAMMAAYLIATMGTDIIFGYSGQLSLGQAGFMLVGAYASTIAQQRYDIPFLLALVVSGVLCAVVGFAFGWPASRLSGVYLMVVTLAFALAVPELAAFFDGITGGTNGLVSTVPPWIAGGGARNRNLLVFAVVVAAIVAIAVILVCRSKPGRQWRAVRANETAAAANGVRVSRQKVLAFSVGAGLSGLGGAMVASLTGYLSPESFGLWDSIYLVVAVVIGGRASPLGAAIGAALVVGVPYATSGSSALSGIALGIALILVLLVRPQGIRGLIVAPALWLLDLTTGRRPRETGGSDTAAALTAIGPPLAPKPTTAERPNGKHEVSTQ